MISTITSKLKAGVSGVEAIRCAFPMGSMTGAPKIRSMELIEKYESTKRGLYSGSVGYFTPQGISISMWLFAPFCTTQKINMLLLWWEVLLQRSPFQCKSMRSV